MKTDIEGRTKNGSVFIGVVQAPSEGAIYLAILDDNRKSLNIDSFNISPFINEDVIFFKGEMHGQFDFGEDFDKIKNFLRLHCNDASSVRVLLAVPNIYADPDFPGISPAPCSILDEDSILIKLLFLFSNLDLVALLFAVTDINDYDTKIVLRTFPEEERAYRKMRQPLYLKEGVLMACSKLLTTQQPSLKQLAGVAALLAKWTSAYSYWSSFGRVQSPQDLVEFMRRQQSRSYVSSASEIYGVRKRPKKPYPNAPQIPLEFALAMQKHKDLEEHDALKVALAHVCNVVEITLTCHSTRADSVKPEYTQVWPLPKAYSWALDQIVDITDAT